MRVVSFVVVEQADNAVTVVVFGQGVDKLKHLVALFDLDFALDYGVVTFAFGLFKHIVVLHAQNFRQTLCRGGALLVGFEVDRSHYYLPHRGAFGKHVAVGVVNRSALGGERCIGKLLVDRALLQLAALKYGQHRKP